MEAGDVIMKTYWEEDLHELNDLGFYNRLMQISKVFNKVVEPKDYKRPRMYYVIQADFQYIKIGSSKNPHKRLFGLQTGNPQKLFLLFFRDIEKEMEWWDAPSGPSLDRKWTNIQAEEEHQRDFLCPFDLRDDNGNAEGEWIKLDDRAKRMLVRSGRIAIEELAKKLNLNYSEL